MPIGVAVGVPSLSAVEQSAAFRVLGCRGRIPAMRIARAAAAVLVALCIGGCGKSNIVAVKRPVLPIYVCDNVRELRAVEGCAGRFDAGQLIGMRLPAAEKRAEAHGFTVRKVAPGAGALLEEAESNRLDVECDTPARDCTVVRIVKRG
jgi:hypothetical protein